MLTIQGKVHVSGIKTSPKRSIYAIALIALTASSCTTKKVRTTHNDHVKDNATLIVMAYPEEIVRTTESFYSKLLPLIGMGVQGYIRGGHACMILIKDGSSTFEYFDLGRYISPDGYARARGVNTDPETSVDIKAVWDNGKIANTAALFRWLYDHPEKTRGYGDLYASMSESVSYERVKEYIKSIQDIGVIKYGPFDKEGSNCARFVTDAMLNGILDTDIQKRVHALYWLTPSVLSNVEAANSYDYYFITNKDSVYKSTKKLSTIQRQLLIDWGKGYDHIINSYTGTLNPPVNNYIKNDWQWLGGIGYGVWYHIEKTNQRKIYKVSQYCVNGNQMFSALFKSDEEINLHEAYQFDYPSHYKQITLKIGAEKSILLNVK